MRIADPACGTGGFLLAAYEYLVKSNPVLDRKAQRFLNEEAIRGTDIVPSVTRLCAMNLYLHRGAGTRCSRRSTPSVDILLISAA